MRNGIASTTCLLLFGCFAAVAETGSVPMPSEKAAQEQAEVWLKEHRMHVGWDTRKGQCATIGVSIFDCPRGLSDREFHYRRDRAYFSAYAKMAQEQLGLLRQHKIGEENVRSGVLGGVDGIASLSNLFGDIMRPWESGVSRFVWRTKSLSDDDGNDCPPDGRTLVVKSENSSRLDGAVQGLDRLRYFESWDRKGSIYEVAVAGIQIPSRSLQVMQDFVKGVSQESARGDMSIDEWLSAQDGATLVGVRSYCDKYGHAWVVGFAPVLGNDMQTARQRARFWAAFAFGSKVQVERRLVQGGDLASFYGERLSLDAAESVVGESYPEDMVQYRRLQGRCVIAGRAPLDVVACILRSGTGEFRKTAFKGKVEKQVRDDFVAGRKKSLLGLREAIKRRMSLLTGPEDNHRRQALTEALEKLDRELQKLE